MKPSTLKRGDRLIIEGIGTKGELPAIFHRREPAQCGRQAINFLAISALDGDRCCQMSDYDLSRRGRLS